MADFTWINEAPIVELTSKEELAARARAFLENLVGWDEVTEGEFNRQTAHLAPTEQQDVLTQERNAKLKEEWSKEAAEWNKRIRDTKSIAGTMYGGSGKRMFEYRVNGAPVGLMVFEPASSTYEKVPEINYLVTHPGSENGGGVLIELAVNLSQKEGCDGKVYLIAASETAKQSYPYLGFVFADGWQGACGKMYLTPGSSDKWDNVNGRWLIKKYQGKRYLGGTHD
jgi:hypothetical protein